MEIKEEKKYGENVKNKGKINWTYKKKKKKKEKESEKKCGEREGGLGVYIYICIRNYKVGEICKG